MRLLTLRGDDEIEWKEFNDGMVPPYAILSHTWGIDEVSYTDLLDGSYKSRVGYRKVLFCGQQAALDHLRYFWVDTCCIDKRNNTELTKAINCMFSWYKEAVVCYAYLSDVSARYNDIDTLTYRDSWIQDFQGSRWWTRGWTLQELLAPAHVEFFSAQHTRLGDKRSLDNTIHETTGIPIGALRGERLGDFPLAVRLEWARNRQTTEPEDVAYCLMGIFGISMPMVYGEGRTSALRRLENEIRQTHRTYYRLAWLSNVQDRYAPSSSCGSAPGRDDIWICCECGIYHMEYQLQCEKCGNCGHDRYHP